MNSLVKELIKPFLEENQNETVGIFGGGFKPPTKGHFEIVKKALEQYPEIDTFFVFIGSGTRNGISQTESLLIWEIYQRYLPIKVEVIPVKSPIKEVYDYAKENPSHTIYWFLGEREGSEEDKQDTAKRTTSVGKYSNIQVKIITGEKEISGTAARQAIKVSPEELSKYLPDGLEDKDVEEIYDILSPVVTENVPDVEDDGKAAPYGSGYKKVNESLSGTDKIEFYKKYYTNLTPPPYKVDIENNSIIIKGFKEALNENATYSSHIDYKSKIKELTQHMLDKGMNIKPLPKVEFVDEDSKNAQNFFGKTAYYDPNTQTIVLYTEGRHPKDIVRSYAHEMVHHIQNLEGRLDNINTTNTQEDDNLNDIEKEAYLNGNITFRNWTDSLQENLTKEDQVDQLERLLDRWSAYSGQYDLLPQIAKLAKGLRVNNGPSIVYRAVPGLDEYPYTKQEIIDFDKEQGIVSTASTKEQAEYFITDDADWAYILEYKPHIIINFDEFEEKYGWTGNWGEGELLIDVPKSKLLKITKVDIIKEADDHLNDIEAEANLKGTMTFRNWTDDLNESYILQDLENQYDIDLDLYDSGEYLILSRMVIPKNKRGEGIGSKVMNQITQYADKLNKPIYLTPSKDFGATSISRLERFYNQFGFKKKDKSDFSTRETMVRMPLNEIGDTSAKSYDYALTSENYWRVKYKFTTDSGLDYIVKFEIDSYMSEVLFYIDNLRGGNSRFMTLSNRGELYKVMSTVTKIIKEFMDTHPNIDTLVIAPSKQHEDDNRRFNLYAQYVKNTIDPSKYEVRFDSEEIVILKKNKIQEKKKVKDPFGLNAYALELARGLEESLNQKYTIYSDMDGVLTNFDIQFEKISGGKLPSQYEKTMGIDKFWELIHGEGIEFWSDMPWMDDGKQYWEYIKKYNPILLSAPSKSKVSRDGKKEWRDKNLPGTKLLLAAASDKQKYSGENKILIDDKLSTIREWRSKGGIGILHISAQDTIKKLKQLGL